MILQPILARISIAARFLVGACVLLTLGAGTPRVFAAGPTAPSPSRPPSLILITVEGLRPDHLSCYGAKQPTPGFDRIATAGWIFEQAVTPSASTLPALATLMTGRTPFRHHVWDDHYRNKLSDAETTLAEILKARGYKTAAFLGSSSAMATRGFDQGFGTYQDGYVAHPSGTWNLTVRPARLVSAGAVSWLSGMPSDSPFFLWLHFSDAVMPGVGSPTQAASDPRRTYAERIASVDAEVAAVLDQAKGVLGPSGLVVLTADHGFGLGDHGEQRAGFSLYESTLHVPLLIGRPLAPASKSKQVADLVGLQDLLPTLRGLLRLPPLAHPDGRDALSTGKKAPAAYHASALEGREIYGWTGVEAVAMGSWRLLMRGSEDELYDLATDPGQARNLASASTDRVVALKRALGGIARGASLPEAHYLSGPEPRAETAAGLKSMHLAAPTLKQARTRRPPGAPRDAASQPLLEEMRLRIDILGYRAMSSIGDSLLQADPENLMTLVGVGAVKARGDEASRKSAKELLTRAQALYPLEPEIYHELAHVAFSEERYADARVLLRLALELGPRQPAEVTYDLACAYARNGEIEPAVARLKESVRLGYRDQQHLRSDPDLEKVLARPAVQEWLKAEFPTPAGS